MLAHYLGFSRVEIDDNSRRCFVYHILPDKPNPHLKYLINILSIWRNKCHAQRVTVSFPVLVLLTMVLGACKSDSHYFCTHLSASDRRAYRGPQSGTYRGP